jgi:hypothetical protein
MNLLRKEEKDKLECKELSLVLLLTISKRKELKNQKSEKLWFNKQREKSRKENKRYNDKPKVIDSKRANVVQKPKNV